MKKIIFAAFIFLLVSCSPVKVNQTVHVIDAVPCSVPVKARSHISLYVAPPSSDAIYNRSDMIYSLCPQQLSSFAKNRWAATPGQMLQPLIVCTLQKTHHFYAVSASPVGIYDYMLDTQIIKLQQDFTSCSSEVNFILQAQIVDTQSGKIIASKQFCATVPAPVRSPCGGVVAANQAASEVLRDLARFCLQYI